jgi:hypothetical protein
MTFSTAKGTTTGLTFLHPDLTIIVGKPTYATVRKLQKERYAMLGPSLPHLEGVITVI